MNLACSTRNISNGVMYRTPRARHASGILIRFNELETTSWVPTIWPLACALGNEVVVGILQESGHSRRLVPGSTCPRARCLQARHGCRVGRPKEAGYSLSRPFR